MTGDAGTHDPRRRRGVPDRLLLPPGPLEPELARRWAELPFEHRRRLAVASGRPDLHPTADLDPADAELVRALGRARAATGWRLQAAALVLGWLLLMTLWGFGRSTFPEQAGAWLVTGLVAGGAAWLAAGLAAARRVRRARRVAGGGPADGGRRH